MLSYTHDFHDVRTVQSHRRPQRVQSASTKSVRESIVVQPMQRILEEKRFADTTDRASHAIRSLLGESRQDRHLLAVDGVGEHSWLWSVQREQRAWRTSSQSASLRIRRRCRPDPRRRSAASRVSNQEMREPRTSHTDESRRQRETRERTSAARACMAACQGAGVDRR